MKEGAELLRWVTELPLRPLFGMWLAALTLYFLAERLPGPYGAIVQVVCAPIGVVSFVFWLLSMWDCAVVEIGERWAPRRLCRLNFAERRILLLFTCEDQPRLWLPEGDSDVEELQAKGLLRIDKFGVGGCVICEIPPRVWRVLRQNPKLIHSPELQDSAALQEWMEGQLVVQQLQKRLGS